jgi:hypothetical protein
MYFEKSMKFVNLRGMAVLKEHLIIVLSYKTLKYKLQQLHCQAFKRSQLKLFYHFVSHRFEPSTKPPVGLLFSSEKRKDFAFLFIAKKGVFVTIFTCFRRGSLQVWEKLI